MKRIDCPGGLHTEGFVRLLVVRKLVGRCFIDGRRDIVKGEGELGFAGACHDGSIAENDAPGWRLAGMVE